MQRGREAIMSRIDEVRSLVARMVRDKIKYRQGRYELDDLVQEGVLGVLMYADHYDPDKGTLGTFVYVCAYRWIIQRVFVCGQYARRRINNETLSLNRHVGHRRVCGHGDDNEVELMDLIPSECDVEHDATVQAEADRVFEVAQEVLKDKPLYVLRRLYSDDEPTYRQVGEELGCSHQRVEQLKTIALRGVKVALRVNEKP